MQSLSHYGVILTILIWAGTGTAESVWFDHIAHGKHAKKAGQKWACSTCHIDDAQSNQIRPGRQDHSTCDAAGCHAQDFYEKGRETRPVCTVCHVNQQPWQDLREIKAFPSSASEKRTFCINFSHRDHLKQPELGKRSCGKCHKIDAKKSAYTPPNHGDCEGCHTEKSQTSMSDCAACHAMGRPDGKHIQCSPTVPWRSRQIARRFSHETHRRDIRKPGSPALDCGFCHWGVNRSKNIRKLKLMHGFKTMQNACGPCHNGRTAVPGTKRRVFSTGDACNRCHGSKFSSGIDAPAGH